jgi:hypothetical protein
MFITLAAVAEQAQLVAKVAKVAEAKGPHILVDQVQQVGKEIQAAALEAEAVFLVDQVWLY